MGKSRATVTTCDYTECEEHYMGDVQPEGWLNVIVKHGGETPNEKLTFCSYEDLHHWAQETSESLAIAEQDNGD